jgi:hypothetical protein
MQQPSVRAKKARLATSRAIVTYLPIAAIVPDPSNPRKHSPEQVRAIANSIEAFGFNAPILIDKESRIVAGQGRLEAARLLGFEEVPAIRLEHLSEQQAKAYTLADNKLTDRSSWDDRKVAIVLKELSEIALDFEIEATVSTRPRSTSGFSLSNRRTNPRTWRTNLRPQRTRRHLAWAIHGTSVPTACSAGTPWIRRHTRSTLARRPPRFSPTPRTMSR